MTTPERLRSVIDLVKVDLALPNLWYDFGHNKAIRVRMKERQNSREPMFPCALLILDDRERSTGQEQRRVDLRIVFGELSNETDFTEDRYTKRIEKLQAIAEATLLRLQNCAFFGFLPATTVELARLPYIGTDQLYEGTPSNLFSEPLDCVQLMIRGLSVATPTMCKSTQTFF